MKHTWKLFAIAIVALSLIGGTLIPTVSSQSYGLQYNLNYTTPAYPGGSTILVNIFTNSGTVPEQVTGISLTSDLGTFTASSGLPLAVPVGQKVELNMTEQIPSSTSVASHPITASITFQYQDPSTLAWVTPTTSPLTVQGSINVVSNPTGLAAIGLVIIAAIVALVVIVVILVVMLRRRRTPPQMGYPPTAPPSSPGPAPTP